MNLSDASTVRTSDNNVYITKIKARIRSTEAIYNPAKTKKKIQEAAQIIVEKQAKKTYEKPPDEPIRKF